MDSVNGESKISVLELTLGERKYIDFFLIDDVEIVNFWYDAPLFLAIMSIGDFGQSFILEDNWRKDEAGDEVGDTIGDGIGEDPLDILEDPLDILEDSLDIESCEQ